MAHLEVSEENKENLPLWLIEASAPLWRSAQALFERENERIQTGQHGNSRRKSLSLQKKDPELAEALARLSICGRGGPVPRAATVPNTRPRQRSKLPDNFRFELYADQRARRATTTDAAGAMRADLTAAGPNKATLITPSAPAIGLPRPKQRMRSATYPGPRGGNSTGGYERILYHSTVPGRVPLLSIKYAASVGDPGAEPILPERRCVSWDVPRTNTKPLPVLPAVSQSPPSCDLLPRLKVPG